MLKSLSLCLTLFVAIFTSQAFAQPTYLPPGGKVEPLHLLEFQDDPGHFIFVGKYEGEQQSQHNVFEIKNGQISEILMINGFVMFDGGSMDLQLNGNLRLFVPSNQKYNYVDGRTASYMIYPDRAREPLIKRKMTRERLTQLGLGGILKPEPPPQAERAAPKQEKYKSLPKDAQLILMSIGDEEGLSYKDSDKIEENIASILKSAGPGCLKLDKRNELYRGNWLAACPAKKMEKVLAELAKVSGLTVQKIASQTDLFLPLDSQSSDDALALLTNYKKPFGQRMTALSYLLFGHRDYWTGRLSTDELGKLIHATHVALTLLGAITDSLADNALMDMKFKMAAEQNIERGWNYLQSVDGPARLALKQTETYQHLIGPLRGVFVSILNQLRDFGTPETSRLVLLKAGGADGEALPLLNEAMVDAWLAWITDYIGDSRRVPELISPQDWKDQQWQQRSHSGGIFTEAKLSGSLADVYQWSQERGRSLFMEAEDVKAYSLVTLGQVPDNKIVKKKIVTFIIQADAMFKSLIPKIQDNSKFFDFLNFLGASEEAVPVLRQFWRNGSNLTAVEVQSLRRVQPIFKGIADADVLIALNNARRESFDRSSRRREKIDGSDALVKFIQMFAWPQPVFLRAPGFSMDTYYTNVLDILIELLDNSENTVKNQGTYMALLDTAVGLQKSLNSDRQELPRRSSTLRRRQAELAQVIQRKLLGAISLIQGSGDQATCEALLSPDPWTARRNLPNY